MCGSPQRSRARKDGGKDRCKRIVIDDRKEMDNVGDGRMIKFKMDKGL